MGSDDAAIAPDGAKPSGWFHSIRRELIKAAPSAGTAFATAADGGQRSFGCATVADLISLSLLVDCLLLLPIVDLGVTAGTRFFSVLSDSRFYRIFQVILLLMAMGLVWKGSVAVF